MCSTARPVRASRPEPHTYHLDVNRAAVASPASSLACDVLVVGGGINGAGIARDLAGRGLDVVLCERDDLAAHTSSASTKLIHGGLRYLEYYEFGLVRKALQEREVLLRSAPHLMWPLRFVMPHAPAMRPAWMIRAGLFLYDHLARREWLPGSGRIDLRTHAAGAPLKAGYTRGFIYSDGWVDDARLVALCAVDAAERGATVLTRTACIDAMRHGTGWQATLRDAAGVERQVSARALVNAAGPWAEQLLKHTVRNADGSPPHERASLRLVRGSHIVLPRLFAHEHAYLFQAGDGRIVFAIPYERDFTLIGTTDVEVTAPDGAEICSDAEAAYLCAEVNRYFRSEVRPEHIVWRYAGVRPLLEDHAGAHDAGPPQGMGSPLGAECRVSSLACARLDGTKGPCLEQGRALQGQRPLSGSVGAVIPPKAATRDYKLELDRDGAPLLTVWGGKITTFRKLAEQAADQVCMALNEACPAWTRDAFLPGGDLSAWIGPAQRPDTDFARFVQAVRQRHPWLAPELAHRLARAYGSRIDRVLRTADGSAATQLQDLGAEIAPGLFEAELRYLRDHEWAASADDVLWRRSKIGLHLLAAHPAGPRPQAVSDWFASR
ncbi:glycerol-3-phosphate dehydrogenase [Thiomonas sp.]|uniref:glycerol-3-phosphate dehydrogenase n=1 Tax=Thiomonas sp. TaxID=2047785 RepID=UPI0039B8BECA